ncbi:MAG: Zn-ribbon domain-containing OB-fold protein [Metallosphaera yellowstonensis]|uniref:Putative nucleic-acid-binding protein containing a Zn-ribbon n=1 Tax=Metallosphaera yellowstonensis MK1 TaxID=671065 RepID=H2C859_9CREN|nr:Zn-ribbon domain-containing OB-fold protein [Metallosphaera yellowstonensis]EHP68335.1 putative nucleic-acid-binding protein containing a Zn-ribbon [Metallosphaera yellowstonensis MK1]
MKILPPKIWRNKETQYSLTATQCQSCGAYTFPPRHVCNKCGSFKVTKKKLSGKGTLITFTYTHQVRTGFERDAPIYFGLIRLDEGIEIVAPLVDVDEEPKEGARVEAVFRKLRVDSHNGLIEYGTKFRLIDNEQRN